MKNKIILIVIILIGLVSNIFAQQTKFRKAIFLHRSVGGIVYNGGPTTSAMHEMYLYNQAHNLTGVDSVSMDQQLFPAGNNTLWGWWAEWKNPNSNLYQNYLNTSIYSVIIMKECFASQSDMWSEGSLSDTNTTNQTTSNYKWYYRKILAKIAQHTDKFFVWWYIPPLVSGITSQAERLLRFNTWIIDTLAVGLDTYGAVPKNVYFFDYYYYMTDHQQYLFQPVAWTGETSHPNGAGADYVLPYFINETFNSAIAYEESLLPVELSSFSASIIGSTVKLNWKTETEVNNYGFDIERKAGSRLSEVGNFEKIGFVEGNGNSNSPKYYSFEDKNLTVGKYSYRLKQIDTDGQFEYSRVIEVNLGSPMKFGLSQNYPNPFNPVTTIQFSIPEAVEVNLTVYNILGEEVAELVNENKEAGVYTIDFNATGLNSGLYFYKLSAGNFSEVKKLMVVK